MWNRICALKKEGVAVHLLSWSDEGVDPAQLQAMEEQAASVVIWRPRRSLLRAVASSTPTRILFRSLEAAQYRLQLARLALLFPQLVFLDGLWGAALGLSLARDLNIPLVYRAHNVEYEYMLMLARSGHGLLRRLVNYEQSRRTRRWEHRVRQMARSIYEISPADLGVWGSDPSADKASVLSYTLGDTGLSRDQDRDRLDIDVLYVGSLNGPNQVQGLRWFVREVAPLLPGLRLVLAGRDPAPLLLEDAKRAGVEVVANPPDIAALYRRSRVLVNPVWFGSGVHIKMIEMLSTGRPVVSTPVGVRGLSPSLAADVAVARSPSEFGKCISESLARGVNEDQRARVLAEHGERTIADLVSRWRAALLAGQLGWGGRQATG
jgi:glycosyltransferase involved in cell wall biosynthesis